MPQRWHSGIRGMTRAARTHLSSQAFGRELLHGDLHGARPRRPTRRPRAAVAVALRRPEEEHGILRLAHRLEQHVLHLHTRAHVRDQEIVGYQMTSLHAYCYRKWDRWLWCGLRRRRCRSRRSRRSGEPSSRSRPW